METGNQLTMRPRINPSLSTMCGGLPADRKITGTPSEVALLRYADKVANVPLLRSRYKVQKLFTLNFLFHPSKHSSFSDSL